MSNIEIQYNDEYDREHYPIDDWQREVVAKVNKLFGLSDETIWFYHATLQGRVFWVSPPRAIYRFHADEVKCLASLPGFRWFEVQPDRLAIGIEHKQP